MAEIKFLSYAGLLHLINKIKSLIKSGDDNVTNELTTQISELKRVDEVMTARIDTFTSLQEGSTTADAELQDIRVGVDGTVYSNAGTAVREQIGELKGDLNNFQDNIGDTIEIRDKIEPTWESGMYYIINGSLISNVTNIHAVFQCYAGDVFDISMRTQSAIVIQPIILTRKLLTDELFDYDNDIIYAETLEADQNPYEVTLKITEDCYMYINRRENTISFPFSMHKITEKYMIKEECIYKDDLNIYSIHPNVGDYIVKTEDGYEVTIPKTYAYTTFNLYFDFSDIPVSERLMLAYKITPIQMDCEKLNYNFIGNYYRNRNCRSIYRNDIGIQKTEYMTLSRIGETASNLQLMIHIDTNNLQGLSVTSIYTNNIAGAYLSDDETIVKFLISDIRVIDFSKSRYGHELSTNLEYHIDDVFADVIYVDEKDYVKRERCIYGFGDSLMVAGKYRDLSWIQQLYVPGYKLNISYDTNNNGHISNKTMKSVYSPSSYTAGFVDKIVNGSVDVGDDITIFALGIHDYSQNTQGTGYCRLGEIGIKESDGNYNWCTVAGAVETILKKVTSNANRRILWVNVAHNKYGIDTDVDYSLREENNIIEQACKNWGVSVSDVYGKMGMNASNVGGNNIWDGQYTDNMKYDESGNLVSDELYFVTSKVAVSDQKRYTTLWVSSGSNGCYMTCFDSNGNFIRNNAPKWSILPSGTTHIVYNVPKASSVEAMTSIINSFTNGFICDVDEAMTIDSVHFTDKSYRRYLQITNEDVKQLILQDE